MEGVEAVGGRGRPDVGRVLERGKGAVALSHGITLPCGSCSSSSAGTHLLSFAFARACAIVLPVAPTIAGAFPSAAVGVSRVRHLLAFPRPPCSLPLGPRLRSRRRLSCVGGSGVAEAPSSRSRACRCRLSSSRRRQCIPEPVVVPDRVVLVLPQRVDGGLQEVVDLVERGG